MHPPRRFETLRLQFRPVELADATQIYEGYASSPGATYFMNFTCHQHLRESEEFAARCVRCWQSAVAFPWTLTEKDTGVYVGTIELRITPPKADFGYILCQQAWGKGYATEAASAIVRWALEQSQIFRVWATCHPNNQASARVLEKAGLQFETRLRNWEARPQLDEPAGDSLVYAVTKVTPVRETRSIVGG